LLERLTSAPSFAGKDENASLDVLEIGPGKCEVALREWARGLRVGVVDFQPAEYLKEIIVSSAKKMFPGLHGPEVFILTQDRFENQRLIKQHCFWGKRYFYVLGEIRAEEGVPLCPRVARAVGNIYTLHHIPDDKQAAFLAECARLARPLSNNERSCLVVDGRNSVDSLRTILSVLALTGLFGTGGDAIISHARALEPEAILAKTKGNVCKWFAGLLGPDISLPNGRVIIKPLQIWATACHPRRIGLRV
jgi:hypothetical protein